MKVEIVKGNYRKNYKSLKLKVAAYVRVSTELDTQISSFESQRKYYYSKIYRNSNWEFVGIYDDYGISARSVKNRTGFNDMIRDAIDGKIDLILTKSISRFARNTVDSIEYVRLLKEHNVGVIFEEENIYTLGMQSELLLTILSSVAEQESNNYSSRTKLGNKMVFSRGRTRKHLATYGYSFKYGKMKINNEEAEVVKKIFNLYLSGTKVRRIAVLLNENNIKSPYNKEWKEAYVYIILRSQKYTGAIKFGDYIYEHEELRIISEDIFNEAKEKMNRNHNKMKLKEDTDIFSGIIRCGFCGKVYGFDSASGYYVSSVCKRGGCKYGLSISDKTVKRILLEFQNELLSNYDQIFKYKYKDDSNKKVKEIQTKYYNESLYHLDKLLDDQINRFELINKIEDIDYKYGNKKQDIRIGEIKKGNISKVLNILKERLLSIDSFPAYEPSRELVEKLVKYIQFGETLKHHYRNKFNCRIVLKVNDYNSYKFSAKKDLTKICKNENYIELWKFHSIFSYRKLNNYIKVKIVIDKKDIEV